MNKFIIVFAACIILLLILLVVIPLTFVSKSDGSEKFIDENGNHAYYERSIIEKENYLKDHPNEKMRELRSIRSLIKKIYFLKK